MKFTRVNNDVSGNPRYAIHFLAFINDKDKAEAEQMSKEIKPFNFPVHYMYQIALKKSRQLGGKKFHNKQFGGGIVFQSYNPQDLLKDIEAIQQQ